MLFTDALWLINYSPRFKLSIGDDKVVIAGRAESIVIFCSNKGMFFIDHLNGVKKPKKGEYVKTAFKELRKVLKGGKWDYRYKHSKPNKSNNVYNLPVWTGD